MAMKRVRWIISSHANKRFARDKVNRKRKIFGPLCLARARFEIIANIQKKVGETPARRNGYLRGTNLFLLARRLGWGSRWKLLRSDSVSRVKHGEKKCRPRRGKIGTKQVWNETSCLWSTICMYYAFGCANGANEWAHHTNRAECFVLAALLRKHECCEEYDNICNWKFEL